MRMFISFGVAFLVAVLVWLTGDVFTPDLYVETAGNILVMTFVGTAVITSLVLKYKRGRTAMIRRILISLGVGVVDIAFLYGTVFGFAPRRNIVMASIDIVVSAFFASAVTFVLLSLPTPLSDTWRRAIISLGVAFFAAVFVNVQIICFLKEVQNLTPIFAGVFIGVAVATSLVLNRRRG
ncbi:hypothetical protein [Massilia horti]|uniref:Uncharacterized protein n=1 Tax=Massilia horti TaxID=2562153 RepID=A0A4Y9T3G6_9BURK|nr:hypothetical protein [Massilia horti]TFW34210.1 hypothetical protein E4O92_04600 [Massilia horti]